jgi:hypothetical protein
MLILIDGCNLLHVEGILPPEVAGVDAAGLAALVAGSRYRREEAILVMDGPRGGGGGRDRVRVVASGAGRSADAWIAAMVDRSSSPRSILVVSSDREVQRHARRRRCRVLDAERFLRQIGEDAVSTRSGRRGGPLPRGHARQEPLDTEAWIRAFGIAEADLMTPPAAANPAPSPPAAATSSPSPLPRPSPPGHKAAADLDLAALDRFDTSEWLGERQSPPDRSQA